MPYDLFEHRHRFSVWAAARAVQRGWTVKIDTLREAIEQSGVVSFVRYRASEPISSKEFDDVHRKWCNSILGFLKARDVPDVTYGRAAKLIAIYVKSMVVLGIDSNTDVSRIAHPPIDRILLQNMSHSPRIVSKDKVRWRKVSWTKLDESAYYQLVNELRKSLADEEPFWVLEQFWTVTSE